MKYICVLSLLLSFGCKSGEIGVERDMSSGETDVGSDLVKNASDVVDSFEDSSISRDLTSSPDLSSDSNIDQNTNTDDSPLLAFPGAVGFGADVVGGRGGRVIYVTNLDDSGQGSLRAAVEAEGPRIVIFRVGGTITIGSPIMVENPFLTIAGHTAPGEGIMIRGNGARSLSIFRVSTNDVIFRHLKMRLGPSTNGGECTSDTIQLVGADRIMVDHISGSWTTDQILTAWPGTNVTVQNSIFSEALFNSTHSDNCQPDGPLMPHALGPIVGSGSKNVSFFENLFANNIGRNPLIAPNDGGDFEVVNNLVYNVCYAMGFDGRDGKEIRGNFIGNYIKWGPNSCAQHRNNINLKGSVKAYLKDNLTPFRAAGEDEWLASSEQQVKTPADSSLQSDAQFDFPIKSAISAAMVYEEIPKRAGAQLVSDEEGNFVTFIDIVDQRIFADTSSGTPTEGSEGRRLDHPDDVGGWPNVANGTAYPDADEDGMPDAWEDKHGLDKNSADGNEDPDEDGYTNIEEYLNQTQPQ